MSPDDERHGSIAGYKCYGCRCDKCKIASARYEKRRKWLVHQGLTPTLPARGFHRRVHALMAIGWTQLDIAQALGIAQGNLSAKMRLNDTVRRATHEAMCDVYERLCMSPQSGVANRRTARIAAKNGWAPPLAWDDIDRDAKPVGKVRHGGFKDSIDEAMIDRVLRGGERPRKLTKAEAREVYRRALANGMTTYEIQTVYGLNLGRYSKDAA
jgi:hypothetical protein